MSNLSHETESHTLGVFISLDYNDFTVFMIEIEIISSESI